MRLVSLVQRYEVAPSSSVKVTFYTVSPAKTFKLKELVIDFPVGTDNLLEVQFFRNEMPILPSDPNQRIIGENVVLKFHELPELVSGEQLNVVLTNKDTAESKSCIIKMEGVEE